MGITLSFLLSGSYLQHAQSLKKIVASAKILRLKWQSQFEAVAQCLFDSHACWIVQQTETTAFKEFELRQAFFRVGQDA